MFCENCRCEINKSGAAFCPNCGAPLITEPNENTTIIEQQSSKPKKKKLLALIVTLVIIIIIGTAVLMVANRQPRFKMEADGTLYLEKNSNGEVVLIPTEFDGKVQALEDSDSFYGSFEYDGSMKRFLKYYSCLTNQCYGINSIYIYCNDYTLLFATNGTDFGSAIKYDEDGPHITTVRFLLYRGKEEIESFQTVGELINWLQ